MEKLRLFIICTSLLSASMSFANKNCAQVKSHLYNHVNNVIHVKLTKDVKTVEGLDTNAIDVLKTDDKFKVKMAALRGGTICFQNLSFEMPKRMNFFLAQSLKKKVDMFHYAIADSVKLIQKEDLKAKL